MKGVKLVSKNLNDERVLVKLVWRLCQHVGLRFVIGIYICFEENLIQLGPTTASGDNPVTCKTR